MRAGLTACAASVLINAGVLFSLDHVMVEQDLAFKDRQPRASRGVYSMDLEFVESPPGAHLDHRPKKTRRISDRDALNRDLRHDKRSSQGAPHAKMTGTVDQLKNSGGSISLSPGTAATAMEPKSPLKTQKTEAKQVAESPEEERPSPSPKSSQPRPSAISGSGRGLLTLSKISRSKSRGAQLYGLPSFEARGSVLGEYMKNLEERIWMAWFPYLIAHYPNDFKTVDALVNIRLDAEGQVKDVSLIESKSSALFAAFCMESVRRAGPFGPLPQEVLDLNGKDDLEIKFAFHYW